MPSVYFLGGPAHGQVRDMPGTGSIAISEQTKTSFVAEDLYDVAPPKTAVYTTSQFKWPWGQITWVAFIGDPPGTQVALKVAEEFNWFPKPPKSNLNGWYQDFYCLSCNGTTFEYNQAQMTLKCVACKDVYTEQFVAASLAPPQPQKPKAKTGPKVYIKPCLKCKEMRGFTYDLKKDWYKCTICEFCYSPETMKQIKPNFTYPATAKWLKTFFPFPVDSSYPNEYKKQMFEKESQKYGMVQSTSYFDDEVVYGYTPPKSKVPSYRDRASVEFEGVEDLDPSLWTADGDAGLL